MVQWSILHFDSQCYCQLSIYECQFMNIIHPDPSRYCDNLLLFTETNHIGRDSFKIFWGCAALCDGSDWRTLIWGSEWHPRAWTLSGIFPSYTAHRNQWWGWKPSFSTVRFSRWWCRDVVIFYNLFKYGVRKDHGQCNTCSYSYGINLGLIENISPAKSPYCLLYLILAVAIILSILESI